MQHFIENKDFPDELKKTVKNIDLALSELEQLVDKFTSTPLLDAQTLVLITLLNSHFMLKLSFNTFFNKLFSA